MDLCAKESHRRLVSSAGSTLTSSSTSLHPGGHARDEFGSYQHGSLTSLPPDFGNLRCLTHLDLSFNRLSTLPSCILHLPSLHVLLVSHNSLVTLPEDFGCLSKLTFFSAMKNQLKDLPQSIGELSMLQDLDLSENALELLPEEVGNLHNCKELDLSGNRLSSIPDSLGMYFIWEEKDMGLPSFWYSLGPLRPLVSFPRVISINDVILEPNGRDIQKDHARFSQCL